MPILGVIDSSKKVSTDTGAMFPLQVITVGPAGASSITFTNIPTTGYSHLQLRCFHRDSRAVSLNTFLVQVGNGTIDTVNNYYTHMLQGDGASATANAYGPTNSTDWAIEPGASATSGIFAATIIDILDYADTNKNKTIRMFNGADLNGSGRILLTSALWSKSPIAAINTIKLSNSASSNFAQYSQFALYGVK